MFLAQMLNINDQDIVEDRETVVILCEAFMRAGGVLMADDWRQMESVEQAIMIEAGNRFRSLILAAQNELTDDQIIRNEITRAADDLEARWRKNAG